MEEYERRVRWMPPFFAAALRAMFFFSASPWVARGACGVHTRYRLGTQTYLPSISI